MTQCPKCKSVNIISSEKTAKCLECKWSGLKVDLIQVAEEPLHVRALNWLKNAGLRLKMSFLRWRHKREIEKAVELEEMTEGAFSYIPVIDRQIEEMIVHQIEELGLDPTDATTFIGRMRIRKRPSSLTWEIDEKEVLQLAWVDTGRDEIVYRLKKISQSKITLITRPTDIKKMPTDIKIVSH